MASFMRGHDLWIRCDACGKTEEVAERQTDRLLCNDWMRENGWKWVKVAGRYQSICRECKTAMEERKRAAWLRKTIHG